MIRRVFYAASGPADLIESHRHWVGGTHNPSEVSVTFSGQIQDFCHEVGAQGYFVSVHPDGQKLRDGDFVHEHRPKRPARGLRYHIEEIRYGMGLLRTARAFKADVALLDSGTTHFFAMALFRAFGIHVVPILHNTLWPKGFRPTGFVQRMIERLDAVFWRHIPSAAIAVSPEAERQVDELAPGHASPIFQTRAQFLPEYFANIPPPPRMGDKPFQVMFIGRVDRIKGVLDIPRMARRIEDERPGLVHWVVCGRGPDYDEMVAMIERLGVGHLVEARGWTSLDDLREVYAASHAAIVPTTSLFAEGLAMTAAEAILAGRPLISNPVVPALELLRPAAVSGRTNDYVSHADAVVRLATDPALYERLRASCASLGKQFYDRDMGLAPVLHRALSPIATT